MYYVLGYTYKIMFTKAKLTSYQKIGCTKECTLFTVTDFTVGYMTEYLYNSQKKAFGEKTVSGI